MAEKKSYYERLAESPQDALEAVAQRRNLSLEELKARIANIHTVAERGEHLTLGQATSFRDAPDSVPTELREHLDGCKYCQDLVDGLAPSQLTKNIERLEQEIDKLPAPGSAVLLAVGGRLRSIAIPAMALIIGIVSTLLTIPNALFTRTLWPQTTAVHTRLAERLEAKHVQVILNSEDTSGAPGARSGPLSLDYSMVSPAGQSEIAGRVSTSCEVLETSEGKSEILCFKPSVAPRLSIALTSGDGLDHWTHKHSGSHQASWKFMDTAFHEDSFFAANALKPGDDVWVWKSDAKTQPDSAAVAASLEALEKAASAPSEKTNETRRAERAPVSKKSPTTTK